jgi:hypothetical protein
MISDVFEVVKLEPPFAWMQIDERLGVVIKSLNPKRTKDGRSFDIVSAYFGFQDELAANRFAAWVNRKWPQGNSYLPMTVVRPAQRLGTGLAGWEVKVRAFPQIAELVRLGQAKLNQAASQQAQMPDYSNAALMARPARKVINSRDGMTAVGVE